MGLTIIVLLALATIVGSMYGMIFIKSTKWSYLLMMLGFLGALVFLIHI